MVTDVLHLVLFERLLHPLMGSGASDIVSHILPPPQFIRHHPSPGALQSQKQALCVVTDREKIRHLTRHHPSPRVPERARTKWQAGSTPPYPPRWAWPRCSNT